MRFIAPPHAGSVDLTSGTYAVVDGILEVPDDISAGELSGLSANGYVPEPVEPEAAAPVIPAASGARRDTSAQVSAEG